MARRPRNDAPGRWHHVGNRAIAKRPYFESRSDQRVFLALVAGQVRAGRLEVHAYCLMTTHFHLLVRSPIGELSEAMRRIQSGYARYFNRRRRRDGPLIRGRFFSKRVETDGYRRAVVRYIDANPVQARMVATPAEHEFGSAGAYLGRRRPPWLCTSWVESFASASSGNQPFGSAAYLRTFGLRSERSAEAIAELVEARLESTRAFDAIDDLIGRTPEQVRRWLARKARLADGHEVGLPVCGPTLIDRAIGDDVAEHGDRVLRSGRFGWSSAEVVRVGLLRDVAGQSIDRVGRATGLRRAATRRRLELHAEHLGCDAEYAERAERIVRAALEAVT